MTAHMIGKHRSDRVQCVVQGIETLDFWCGADTHDHPKVNTKRCVDEVCGCTVSFHCNDNPSVDFRVIAPPITDVG